MNFNFDRDLFYFIHISLYYRQLIRFLRCGCSIIFHYRNSHSSFNNFWDVLNRQKGDWKKKVVNFGFRYKFSANEFCIYIQIWIYSSICNDGHHKFSSNSSCRHYVPFNCLILLNWSKSGRSSCRKQYRKIYRSFLYVMLFDPLLNRLCLHGNGPSRSLTTNNFSSFHSTNRYYGHRTRHHTTKKKLRT